MLFLSFLASLSLLASSRPIYLFVGPVIHYFCRLGLMGFLLFILSILCGPHYWAFLYAWASTNGPQQTQNGMRLVKSLELKSKSVSRVKLARDGGISLKLFLERRK